MSDALRGSDKSDHAESLSLLHSLYITCFAAAIGGGLFLMATFYIAHDYHQVELYIIDHRNKSCRDVITGSDDDDDEENHPLVHSDYHEQASVNT